MTPKITFMYKGNRSSRITLARDEIRIKIAEHDRGCEAWMKKVAEGLIERFYPIDITLRGQFDLEHRDTHLRTDREKRNNGKGIWVKFDDIAKYEG